MTTRRRKGMLIKNTNVRPVVIKMKTRAIRLEPGEEKLITADEVRDAKLREFLQVRAISIVRPAKEGEEEALLKSLSRGAPSEEGASRALGNVDDQDVAADGATANVDAGPPKV